MNIEEDKNIETSKDFNPKPATPLDVLDLPKYVPTSRLRKVAITCVEVLEDWFYENPRHPIPRIGPKCLNAIEEALNKYHTEQGSVPETTGDYAKQ